MSSLATQTRQLERVIRRKEKIFLMEQYAASMLQQLEPRAEEGQADEQVIDALRIAYRYVNLELGERLSALLLAYGYSGDLEAEREAAEEAEASTFAEEEEEEEAPQPKAKKGKDQGRRTGPAVEGEEDEEAGVLFERDIYTGRKQPKKAKGAADADGEEDAADLFADDEDADTADADVDDLFADDDADADADAPKTARKKKGKTRKTTGADEEEDAAGLFDDDAEADADTADADAADLFADEDADADAPKIARKKKGKTRKAAGADEEEDAADLFDEDDADADTADADADDLFADEDGDAEADAPKTARKKKDKTRKTTGADEEEDAADLFADDADADADTADADADDADADDPKTARKKKGKNKKSPGAEDEEDAADLFADDAEAEAEADTADADADDDAEADDPKTTRKKKRKKKRTAAADEDADLVGEALDETEEAPRRFKPTQGHQRKETPGFAAPEGAVERDEKSRRGYDFYAPDEKAAPDQDPKGKPRKKPRSLAAEEEEEEEEAQAPARKGRPGGRAALEEEEDDEEEAREAKPKKAPRIAAEEDKEEKNKAGKDTQAADPKSEEKKLNLDALTYQVTIEDLRAHMGITLVKDDHVKLIRRWEQKSRDNSIRLLLDDPKATQHPYALIPRITRYIKDGQMIQVNVLNLVRHFFQLFENVPQVIQLKNEPFFVTEVPTLEWAVVACEALPDTLNKTVLEQRTIFSHYIQKFMSNERRVRRRVLVEALYDIIVLNMVCKEPILRKTVDLTETRRGRQHQLCVNFGAKGIRINSVTRDQRHPQMGMCPSW